MLSPSVRRSLRLGLLGGALSLAALGGLDLALPPDLSRYESLGTMLLDDAGGVLSVRTAADRRWRFAVRPKDVSATYLKLLVGIEDKRFYQHAGVDPLAVGRALMQGVQAGEIVSGASTLSMQTARLLEPRPRTLISKLIEMLRAVQLEWRFSKAEILAIYLTLAPYGGNIEGIRAASLSYFGKNPDCLTLAEAALLVALPQNPEVLRPDRFGQRAHLARAKILQQATAKGLINETQQREANTESIPQIRRPFPHLAPHLADRLTTPTNSAPVATLIDRDLQQGLANLLATAALRQEPEVTLAGLVIDNQSGHIKAYIGNALYFNEQKRGMVDMIPAIRSPGSTLKPFIYGLAFDRLLVHPATVVADLPTRFGSYAPDNFDGSFHGEVTITEALQRSLNLPAVALLDRIGPVAFDSALTAAGVQLQFDRRLGKPTLPIALGGVGISLEQLVSLFTSLSHGGEVVAPQLVKAPSSPTPRALMGAGAAWYVAHILAGAPRPDGFSSASDFAFKTGTSYGFRDAWAIGFTERYTIGIWVGKANGAPCANCVGLKAAAPVLLQAAALLPPSSSVAKAPPKGVLWATSASALPPALQRFSTRNIYARSAISLSLPLKLEFPVDGSIVEIASATATLPLKANGGQRPFTWLVNGTPLPSDPLQREAALTVREDGFARITVVDASGQMASAEAQFRLAP